MLLMSVAFCTPFEARWAKWKRVHEDHLWLKGCYNFFFKSQLEAFPTGRASGGLSVLFNATYFPCGLKHGPLAVQVKSCKYSTYSSVIRSKIRRKNPKQLPLWTELYKPSLTYQYHHLLQEEFLVYQAIILTLGHCLPLFTKNASSYRNKTKTSSRKNNNKSYTVISLRVVSHKKRKMWVISPEN